eukprot:9485627-Pyramimonas_sp.AAC.4
MSDSWSMFSFLELRTFSSSPFKIWSCGPVLLSCFTIPVTEMSRCFHTVVAGSCSSLKEPIHVSTMFLRLSLPPDGSPSAIRGRFDLGRRVRDIGGAGGFARTSDLADPPASTGGRTKATARPRPICSRSPPRAGS